MMIGKFVIVVCSALLILNDAEAFRGRGRDFICCETSDCGGDTAADESTRCRTRTNNPNFDCVTATANQRPPKPYLCERIVCCTDPSCEGTCHEDKFTGGQCEEKMPMYGTICEEQPYLCCDDTCNNCQNGMAAVLFGEPDCSGRNRNRRNACPTVNCCFNSDCTRCSTTGHTAQQCMSRGHYICESSGVNGDPHIETWAHKWFDFHGVCDLELLRADKFDGVGLTVHARTTGRYEYSYISSAAVKIGDDILEVSSYGVYFVNGVESAEMPNMLSQYTVTHTQPNKKKHIFEIDLGFNELVTITTFKDIVAVSFDSASSVNFYDSVGLMGEYGTGKMLARDGETVIEDPIKFGKEWQVRGNETKLFQADRFPQYPEECVVPTPEQQASRQRRLSETKTREEAEAACAWWGPEAKERCVFDVLVSGDLDLAQAGP